MVFNFSFFVPEPNVKMHFQVFNFSFFGQQRKLHDNENFLNYGNKCSLPQLNKVHHSDGFIRGIHKATERTGKGSTIIIGFTQTN